VVTISFDELFQPLYGEGQLPTPLAVDDSPGLVPLTHDGAAGHNVVTPLDGCFHRLKMEVSGNKGSQRLQHQGKTIVAIGFKKCAVDLAGFAVFF